ncbi:predicted glycosyltransferases [Anaerolinea thermolimosa]|uniref:Predicted glycosyltransferases n=1 Tax=Anaerolinea thermolimosa TaxID=229919 RepID=A0A7U9KMI7_9CHLR|nr:glycosyltransferase family 2 protein [Anaerolinea thermolimosa]GAP08605.1 predicted glycosyltransferases [Anaerolinea thermolimosa]
MVENQNPRVAIVVINWNGGDDTLACLDSLARVQYPERYVLVVDNASQDGSPERIRACHPEVTLLESRTNLGFAGGNNLGMKVALQKGADYVLLLNHDTLVSPDFLEKMVSVGEADPSIGVLGPTIYYHTRPEVIWSAGGAIDWKHGVARMIGMDETDQGQYGLKPRAVDFVTGCAMLVKRKTLEAAGLLDEGFFAYYEEVEWCVRIRRAGYQIVYVPGATIWHKISPEAREASATVHYYMTRNRLLFLKKAGAGGRAWAHTLFSEYLRTLVSWSIRPKWRHRREQRRAMVQAIWDYFRGKTGMRGVQP